MNYHPLFVHFPIAFWTTYCLLEFVWSKKYTKLSYWFYLKATFLLVGTASAIPTFLTGKLIGDFFSESMVELHSGVALATIVLFGLISLSYSISWIEKDFYSNVKSIVWWRKISELNTNIFRPRMKVLLAVMGLLLITLTGALGGIIAFGPDTDPLTRMINDLFFGK